MKKIPVKILGMSYSQSNIGSYVLVLSEISGKRKIPVIIKPNEAQYIAMRLESVKSRSPFMYDLFKDLTDTVGCGVTEVLIEHLVEGVFYCKIKVRGEYTAPGLLDASVGDAVSLSLTYGCPLYVSKDVMEMAGVVMGDDGTVEDDPDTTNDSDNDALGTLSIEGLEKMLQEAITDEEYELASQLRDKISAMKSKT
jgi:bifunctional DNase/RNase